MLHRLWFFGLVLCLAMPCALRGWAEPAGPAPRVNLRHPVGLALGPDRLYVANQRSGTLSRLDTVGRRVLNEKRVGRSLSDIVRLPDGRLLITDQQQHELISVREKTSDLLVEGRVKVAHTPVSIVVNLRGQGSIASLWARRITIVDTHDPVRVLHTVDLPFSPRLQCFLPSGKHVVVADGFGGRLAIVDVQAGKLVSLRTIEAHNIRGLSLGHDGRELFIAHQHLISWIPTTRNRVSWGQVVSNLVRTVELSELLDAPEVDSGCVEPVRIAHWGLEPVGENEDAAGDPGQIVTTSTGERVVCLSGVNQIAIAADEFHAFQRFDVGKRPTNLVISSEDSIAYVANTFEDSISVVDVAGRQVLETISLGKMPELSLRDQGERFFYDARLSLDGWYSCHSCHPDGHTISQLNDNFGDELYGTPKLVLSLLGTNQTGPWGWNGHQFWIRNQVAKSIKTTMRNDGDGAAMYGDPVSTLTDYLRSLSPPPSILAARGEPLDSESIRRGRGVFETYGCADCHSPTVYTTEQAYDVGLQDEAGQTLFNPPSLRGVSQRDLWLHDGRAKRLRDVFEQVGHPNGTTADLSTEQIDDLVRYLQSL